MGIAYCAIKWEFAGKLYETVHTIHSGISIAAGQNTFTEEDLLQWGFDLLATPGLDNRTDPSEVTFNPKGLIEYIIGFHRGMQGPQVQLKQVYINDGFTLGTPTGNFATFDLDLQCVSSFVGAVLGDYASANNSLMLDKASGQFSRRGGRMFLRGWGPRTSVEPSAEDGVKLTDAARVTLANQLGILIAQPGSTNLNSLSSYFGAGANGALEGGEVLVQYAIGRTKEITVDGKKRRILDNWTQVSTISVDDAQSRDTRRRNKKAVAS